MRTDRAVSHDHLQAVSNKIGSLSTTLSADKMNRCDRVWHSPWDLDSKKQFSDCGAKNCNDRYNLGIEYLRTRLRFPRIINWRRFSTSHRHGSPGESERAGAVRCAGADIGPADFASRIHHVGYGCSNEAGPMALVFRAYIFRTRKQRPSPGPGTRVTIGHGRKRRRSPELGQTPWETRQSRRRCRAALPPGRHRPPLASPMIAPILCHWGGFQTRPYVFSR